MKNSALIQSELTAREINMIGNANIDLGAGYPNFELPKWIDTLVNDLSNRQIKELFHKTFPHYLNNSMNTTHEGNLQKCLIRVACECLNINSRHAYNGFVTYTGSHAIDRVLKYVCHQGRQIITTNPSIDIFTTIANEVTHVEVIYTNTKSPSFQIDLQNLDSLISSNTKSILLASPDNPSGRVLSRDEIMLLMKICVDRDLILIIDQCFAKIDPFNVNIPILADMAFPNLKWIQIWDTGKTFGLADEKVGFIFCSSNLKKHLLNLINNLQCTFPARSLMLFSLILKQASEKHYFDYVNNKIRENIEYITSKLKNTKIKALIPDAGSLMLLDISQAYIGDTNEFTKDLLQKKGIGVIPYTDFNFGSNNAKPMIRIAIGREKKDIEIALDKLINYVDMR